MSYDYTGQTVIITGAGGGLGRAHALAFAQRGASVVVNDFGGARDGSALESEGHSPAEQVAQEIIEAGGRAVAHQGDVTNMEHMQAMAALAMEQFGRIDVLVNNAGILRDKTFTKMPLEDYAKVVDVHLLGSVNATKAVLPYMQEQEYGRIVMTTSSSGLYGNFGQSNYGAAKLGLVGFMHTLKLEFSKYNILVNSICPVAATRMTEDILPPQMLEMLKPEFVSPAVLYLSAQSAPNGVIMTAGAGSFAVARIEESEGLYLGQEATPEMIAERWEHISDFSESRGFKQGSDQSQKFVVNAFNAQNIS